MPESNNIEEAIRRLKIHEKKQDQGGGGGDVADSGPYPDRPGEPDCIYYLRNGVCGYGSNCRYNHPQYAAAAQVTKGSQHGEELPERVGEPDCGYYLKTGTCKYGSTCKYHHPKDRNGAGPVSYNLLGLPMRLDEKPCSYYMRTGSCKFGTACKFHHPQPAAPLEAGNGIPLSGISTYGSTGSSMIPSTGSSMIPSTGSSMIPSTGLPYNGGAMPATWSFPRLPYMSAPRLDSTPAAYAPVYISPPSQGIAPAQGWNTYVGNLSPMASPPSILGSNLVFDPRNQGESGVYSASYNNLPQRPDQPECRHFMNTGTCKYGTDCKYHHPKERRTSPLALNAAAPPGLPSRPGQPLCPNYIMYGICKFGLSCRFDHPFTGYPYGYSLTVPPLPVLDSSMLAYPRMSHPSLPYELSPNYKVNYAARNNKQHYQMNNAVTEKKKKTTTMTAAAATTTTTPDETTDAGEPASEVSHD